ncbi:TonB-dependent receptor [Sphingomonas sp. KR1UV-12]|uniref:TonB-dependent receptor n=1 Tax=Sphingomonas aurea TaxID=3063994 RepID=A0ABT9EJ44_9SPHN|nr:TonB-dependent receptor [Sphingomonas sp. KR1UV-12]MDP1026980.1 TonB-dependent receptor [Sphingomonas sp. KR1UV-12]
MRQGEMDVRKERTALRGASALALAIAMTATPSLAQNGAASAAPAATSQTGDPLQSDVPAGTPATAGGQVATPGTVLGATEGGDITASAAGDDIVVTGLRQSLASAQAIKRNSEQLVDSITATDIGRLPDTNVSEALQRISGIQIQRNRGEGSAIAIRGLTQVRTELNGRDIFSANGGRGLSFEEIGPDLLAGVDVYKNPSAELIEGSLGGTVNLRTRMPFDAPGQIISVTGSVTRYDFAEKNRFGASGLYSNRWETGIGDVGFLVNASWQQTAFREDKIQIEPYHFHGPTPIEGATVENTLVPGFENQNVLVPHGGGFNDAVGNRKRFSAAAAFQWKPADNLEIYAQFLTAHYRYHDYGLSFFAAGTPMTPTPGATFTVEDGVATSGSLSNPSSSNVVYQGNRATMTSDYSAGAKWAVTDRLHASVDYQHIHSTANNRSLNLTMNVVNPSTSLPGLGSNFNVLFDTRGDLPSMVIDRPGYLTDPRNFEFTAIQPFQERNRANGDAVRGDLEWDFDDDSFLRKLSAGGRYSVKEAINRNSSTWSTIGSTCANWSSPAGCYQPSAFPQFTELNPLQATLLRGRAAGLYFGPVLQWRLSSAANPDQGFADVKAISGQRIGFTPFDDPSAFNGTVDEKDISAYFRASFGSRILGMDLDGNTGIRYVRTEEVGIGSRGLTYRDPNSAPVTNPDGTVTPPANVTTREPFTGGRSYTKWLPSVNLRLHVTSKLQARFAFSKNIFRPDFNQLNPSFNLSPTYNGSSNTPQTVNPNLPYDATSNPYAGTGNVSGNPNLRPQQVTSFDGALEWYFAPTGYVFATVFKKNLVDLLDNRTFPVNQTIPGVGAVQFNVSSVVNVSKGGVKGFEVGGQRFFDFLPGVFSGLGVQANFTLSDSDAGVVAQGTVGSTNLVAVPLIGLSKYSYNLIGLYDKYGFNLRVAYNWRSRYLLTTTGVGTQTLPEFVKPYGVLDASISYDFSPNFSLTIDGSNLNNAQYRSYLGTPATPRDFQVNDRRLSARVRVRF